MDVLMLTNAVAPDTVGGIERYVRELSAELVRSGARVTVLAKQVDAGLPLDETGDDGVRVLRYRLPARSSPLFVPAAVLGALAAVRRARAEADGAVLHAHFPVPALPLALARARYLYTFHHPVHREVLLERQGSYPLPRPLEPVLVRGTRATERLVVRRAAALTVLSEHSRRELAWLNRGAGGRALVVPGGLDAGRFAPGASSRDAWGEAASPLLFAARRLTPTKGVAELLRAMPRILAALPRARLALSGTGRAEPELRADALRLGLGEAVRFLGAVGDDELVRWYRSADLVVVPSQQGEGYGLSTAEALACGTPVVGTPLGATPELLAPIDPALLARDSSPEALADAIVALVGDAARADAVRRRLAQGLPDVTWPRVADVYRAEYERLLATPPRRRR